MGRIIAVASGKGGTGKTTLVCNLSIALGLLGKKVCAVDADLTMANLTLYFRVEDTSKTLHDALMGEIKIKEAIHATRYEFVYLIPGALDWEHVAKADPRNFPEIIPKIKEDFDYVIIDCPAGLQMDALSVMFGGEEIVLVTNPDIASISDTMKVGAILKKAGKKVLGFILNRYESQKNGISPDIAEDLMEFPLLGVVPEDSTVREATLEGVPVVIYNPKTKASQAIIELAQRFERGE